MQGFKLYEKYEKNKVKGALAGMELIASATAKNSKTMFRVQQAANAGLAVMNTAEGITEALPNYPLAAAVAISGAAQLSAILSASPDGGGGSAPSPGGGSISAPQQQNFTPETQNFDVSATVVGEESSSTNERVTVAVDGDATMQLMGAIIQAGIDDGTFKLEVNA